MNLPKIRNENLVEQELGKEILLYDLVTNKAYCLNETCALIYRCADGKTSFAELRRRSQMDIPDEIIQLGIDELNRQKLLETKLAPVVSRRSLLQKAAASAIALPVIMSLVAPRAAHAQSQTICLADGTPTGNRSTNFFDYFCIPDRENPPDTPCCSDRESTNYNTCTRPDNQGIIFCDCVCGPPVGDN